MFSRIHSDNGPIAVGGRSDFSLHCQRADGINLAHSGDSDEFVGSRNQDDAAVIENKTETSHNSFISTVCELGSRFCEIGNVFSPVVSFVKNLLSGSQLQSNEQIIEGFSGLLHETSNRAGGLLSNESSSALNELISEVNDLQENNSNNVDLGNIIAQWRETRDAQHLLQMAEHLENGGCESLNPTELRELRNSFVRGLRTLTEAIRDAEQRGNTEALDYLRSAADSAVSGVERAHEASQREDQRLTCEDRAYMRDRLHECCEHLHEGRQSGAFNNLSPSVCNALDSWTEFVMNYLRETEEDEKKEREERERREQCEERCRQESLREFLHVLHKRAEQKKLFYRSLARKAELNLAIEKARLRSRTTSDLRLLAEILLNHGKANVAESLARLYAGSELGLVIEEGIISESMLPASVCESPVFSGIGGFVDLCC